MLTIEQLQSLCANRQYRKTRGAIYNLRYSMSVVGNPDISIRDLKTDGEPLALSNLLWKIFIWMFKNIIVSLEIGEFRNNVIEKILNSNLQNDFDICVLIRSNMEWIEAKSKKMEIIRQITVDFVTNHKNQSFIFDSISIFGGDEQKTFMSKLLKKIDDVYYNKIAELMQGDSFASAADYNLFVRTHAIFLGEHIKKQQCIGRLTKGLITCENEGEKDD